MHLQSIAERVDVDGAKCDIVFWFNPPTLTATSGARYSAKSLSVASEFGDTADLDC